MNGMKSAGLLFIGVFVVVLLLASISSMVMAFLFWTYPLEPYYLGTYPADPLHQFGWTMVFISGIVLVVGGSLADSKLKGKEAQTPEEAVTVKETYVTSDIALQALPARNCAFCKAEVPIGSKFCIKCGAKLETAPKVYDVAAEEAGARYCLNCGVKLWPGDRFCRHCGAKQ